MFEFTIPGTVEGDLRRHQAAHERVASRASDAEHDQGIRELFEVSVQGRVNDRRIGFEVVREEGERQTLDGTGCNASELAPGWVALDPLGEGANVIRSPHALEHGTLDVVPEAPGDDHGPRHDGTEGSGLEPLAFLGSNRARNAPSDRLPDDLGSPLEHRLRELGREGRGLLDDATASRLDGCLEKGPRVDGVLSLLEREGSLLDRVDRRPGDPVLDGSGDPGSDATSDYALRPSDKTKEIAEHLASLDEGCGDSTRVIGNVAHPLLAKQLGFDALTGLLSRSEDRLDRARPERSCLGKGFLRINPTHVDADKVGCPRSEVVNGSKRAARRGLAHLPDRVRDLGERRGALRRATSLTPPTETIEEVECDRGFVVGRDSSPANDVHLLEEGSLGPGRRTLRVLRIHPDGIVRLKTFERRHLSPRASANRSGLIPCKRALNTIRSWLICSFESFLPLALRSLVRRL